MKISVLQVGPIGTNCYLLEDESTNAAAVIDPGGEGARILDRAKADGVEIKLILLTHAHFDHTGGVDELCRALPGVPVYLHPADAQLLGTQVFPAIGVDTVPYGEGDTLTLGSLTISVLHTPGHTPGGVCLQVEDALFTGDTLFLGQLPGDYHVLPGHMGASTLETERKTNYYMREAMA